MLILKFCKEQWFGVIILILFIIYLLFTQINRNNLILENKDLKVKISKLKTKEIFYKKQIVEAEKADTIFLEKILKIKIKENEAIHHVDSLPLSELQKFFTERYGKKSNSNGISK